MAGKDVREENVDLMQGNLSIFFAAIAKFLNNFLSYPVIFGLFMPVDPANTTI